MGQFDTHYLQTRGWLKITAIVCGCISIAMWHGGLWGPYSNMSIEWHYPFTYKFNMAAGGVMICLEFIMLAVNLLMFADDYGGRERWDQLDVKLCKLGSVLYLPVCILGFGHIGWPAYSFSGGMDWHLCIALFASIATLMSHSYQLSLYLHYPHPVTLLFRLRARVYHQTNEDAAKLAAQTKPANIDDLAREIEFLRNEIEGLKNAKDEEKLPIIDFVEPPSYEQVVPKVEMPKTEGNGKPINENEPKTGNEVGQNLNDGMVSVNLETEPANDGANQTNVV